MASKSKSRRRVFRASCILAALIVAGSSFAWFASKDEVTNRLTATADYGVSLVEDFLPPKSMTPGQNVNKDVSVVNTGNVDAFVRAAFENELEISVYGKLDTDFAVTDTYKTETFKKIKKVTVVEGPHSYDTQAAALADKPTDTETTTYVVEGQDGEGKYYIKSTTTETLPDRYANTTEGGAERDAQVAALTAANRTPGVTYSAGTDEVINTVKETSLTDPSLTKAVKLDKGQSLNENTGKLTPNEVTTLQAGGTLVVAASQVVPAKDQFVVSGDDTTPPTQSDYDGSKQYSPKEDNSNAAGLYIFKRTVQSGDSNNAKEYSGYYYDGTDFYALKTKTVTEGVSTKTTPYIDFGTGAGFTLNSDGEITALSGTVSLLTKEYYATTGKQDKDTSITYGTATITPSFGKLTVDNTNGDTFDPSTDLNDKTKVNAVKLTITTGASDNDTVIYIKLDDNWTDHWKLVEPTGTADSIADWFYYKDTVKSGETTEKLVDYVRIDNKVNKDDFVDLVYDLNVVLDSVQVTYNDEGDETADAVPNTWATPALTTNPVPSNGDVSVITAVDWT